MNRYKNYIVEIITIIMLILIDLWTKTLAASKLIESDVVLIPGVLEFHYLENIGAAFSMLSGKMIVFYIIIPAKRNCRFCGIKQNISHRAPHR